MKTIRGKIVVVIFVLVFALIALMWCGHIPKNLAVNCEPDMGKKTVSAPDSTFSETNLPPDLPPLPPNINNVQRFSNLTASEKEELIKKFKKEFKPTVEKWWTAYEGRIPFQLEDFRLDKFVDRDGVPNNHFYTFVFDGTTLVMWEKDGTVKVFYMATKSAVTKLNDLPQGTVPSAKVSISQKDIVRMVKADSGKEFALKDIAINPTGLASALSGGAFVHIAPGGPETEVLTLVFNDDGKLAYYAPDPDL